MNSASKFKYLCISRVLIYVKYADRIQIYGMSEQLCVEKGGHEERGGVGLVWGRGEGGRGKGEIRE